jgi:hypothetical protein
MLVLELKLHLEELVPVMVAFTKVEGQAPLVSTGVVGANVTKPAEL